MTTHLEKEEIDVLLRTQAEGAPPPLSPRVDREVGAAPPPVRPLWPTWFRFTVAAVAGAAVLGVAALFGGLHLQFRQLAPPFWWWALCGGLWLVGALLLTWLAVREAEPEAPPSAASRVAAVAGLFGIFVLAALLGERWAGSASSGGGDFLARGLRCTGYGTVLELAPVLLLFLLIARGAPFRPVRAGVLAGVAAGGWALFLLHLHCRSMQAAHVVLFHLGVALLWGLLGAGFGLWLRRRRRGSGPEAS